jgi:hypothetical protein
MEKLHVSLEGVNDLSFIIVFFFLFTKQKVRLSAANERFTHWLPLFFGEREDYEVKV